MVFYFTSDSNVLYMGKDKFENEDLIKHGWEEDVWFHVDNMSSAHVYLRMNDGQVWDNLPEALLTDLAQLTKANSIQGSKQDNIVVIYTPWSNLKKTDGMETGQVSFHKKKLVKKVHVPTKNNEIVNRLNKTKKEEFPQLDLLKIQHLKKIAALDRKANYEKIAAAKQELERKRKEKSERDYSNVLTEDSMYSNKGILNNAEDFEDDFM